MPTTGERADLTRDGAVDDILFWRLITRADDPAEDGDDIDGAAAQELLGADLPRWRDERRVDAARASRLLAGRRAVRDLTVARGLPWRGFAPSVPGRKPRFADGSGDFSVSHTGRTLLVAVSDRARVGADVETEISAFGHAGLVSRLCTPRELALADGLSGRDRLDWLARLWTVKEAAVKLDGRGIRADLRAIDGAAHLTAEPRLLAAAVAVERPGGSAIDVVEVGPVDREGAR